MPPLSGSSAGRRHWAAAAWPAGVAAAAAAAAADSGMVFFVDLDTVPTTTGPATPPWPAAASAGAPHGSCDFGARLSPCRRRRLRRRSGSGQ